MEKTFEQKQERLNQIISILSSNQDNISLQEISSLYKEGKELVSELNKELDDLKSQVSNEIVDN
jgi:exodeoxyribonuclease VII small subunit